MWLSQAGYSVAASRWTMKHPALPPGQSPPGPLLSLDDVRSVTGVYDNPDFDDVALIGVLAAAEEHLENLLSAPLQRKVVVEQHPCLARRHLLAVRSMGEAGLGTFAGADGTGDPEVKAATADGGESVLTGWRVDATGRVPALTIAQTPTVALDRDLANPVTVTYSYDPVVPERVRSALEVGARSYLLAPNANTPFPEEAMGRSMRSMLIGILPLNQGCAL